MASNLHSSWSAVALRRVTVCVALLLSLQACLLPPPIDPEAEFGNQSPRVVPSSIFPFPSDMPIELSENCTERGQAQRFSLQVVDDDDDDTIFWRVFIDYSADQSQFEEFEDLIVQTDVLPSAAVDLRRSLRVDINGDDPRFFTGPNRFPGPHVVEILISDRPFSDEPFQARQPQEVETTAETAIWAWTVALTDGPCPTGAN